MYRKIAIGSGILFVLGVAIGFIGFPKLLRSMIKKQVNLKPGSEPRQMWEKFPIYVNFKIYVFNVTNPDEIQNGGKPKVNEVGPFWFEEWKDKYDLVDIEEEDAVEFNMRNTFKFRPDLGLSGEEVITMPHPLIQIMAISVKKDKEAMIGIISEAINIIFQPTTPFVSAPFMDLFFRGIDVDCSRTENYAAAAVCLNFQTGSVKGAVPVNDTHYKFSLFGGNNHTDAGRFKVARGVRNSYDIGKVLQVNDEEELSVWNGDTCNQFRGTDSTIFAPLLKPSDGLWAYSADLCRSLGPRFQRRSKYSGIPAYRYVMDFGDVKNEPENQCFCKNYPDDCPLKGTMELSLCNEAPLIASLPHFLFGDPKLITDVDGLDPREDKHGIYIDFEIISGSPINVAKRLQFSLDVIPVPELEVMKNMRELVMPLFWVEESIALDKTFTDMIKKKVFLVININNAFKWLATIGGALGLGLSIAMLYLRQRDEKRVTQVPDSNNAQKF